MWYDFINWGSTSAEPDITSIPLETFRVSSIPIPDNTEAEEYQKFWHDFPNLEWAPVKPNITSIPLKTFFINSIPTTDNTDTGGSISHITVLEPDIHTDDEKSESLSIFEEPSEHSERTNLANTNVCGLSISDHSVDIRPNDITLLERAELYDQNTISKITCWLSLETLTRTNRIKFLYEQAVRQRAYTNKLVVVNLPIICIKKSLIVKFLPYMMYILILVIY